MKDHTNYGAPMMCEPVLSRQTTIRERTGELNAHIRDCLGVAYSIQLGLTGSTPCDEKNVRSYAECLDGALEFANDGMRELLSVLAEISERL